MRSFSEHRNQTISKHFQLTKNLDKPLLDKKYDTEDKERPYFLGFINWISLWAKNPDLKRLRSENLDP